MSLKEKFPELRRVEVPTYFVDLGALEDRARFLKEGFSWKVAYALKANPDLTMLGTMAAFIDAVDCASHSEVDIVRNSQQASAHRILFNNPKFPLGFSSMKFAYESGVRHFTVDNLEDLLLLVDNFDVRDLEIVIRLAALENSSAGIDFSLGPGADFDTAKQIILECKYRKVFKIGLSFHVGSQNSDVSKYTHYLNIAKRLQAITGVDISIVNLGGGIPVKMFNNDIETEDFVRSLADVVDEYREDFTDAEFIIEPGRSMVAECSTLVVPITRVLDRGEFIEVRISDGPFFSYLDNKLHRWQYPLELYDADLNLIDGDHHPMRLVGPTCDPVDFMEVSHLSSSVTEGDYIVTRCAGAYMRSQRTTFNFGYESTLKPFEVCYYT